MKFERNDEAIALERSFDRVERAIKYRAWLLDQVRPYLGSRVLELGCGVGNITSDLLDRERIVALDIEPRYIQAVEEKFGSSPNLHTLMMPIQDDKLADELDGERLDSAIMLNVLEHIEDDIGALRNISKVLMPGSQIVIQVPAHGWLYGAADKALGHIRRYDPALLTATLRAAGFSIVRMWQFNLLGVFGWFVSGRIRKEIMFSQFQLDVYETIMPLIRALEPSSGVPVGLSLMAVARSPGQKS